MEKMTDLRALLVHEVQDLYSAEEQIIEAMPAMIQRANNPTLKKALKEHLKITEQQKKRLDRVQQMLNEGSPEPVRGSGKKKGLLGGLLGGAQECKGMKGLIQEGQKVMAEDMSPEVMDAAIIACAQKIEHYEICGYGTARAYARELNLGQVAEWLEETLNEEYQADDRLTDLALGGVNREAEAGAETRGQSRSARQPEASGSRSVKSPAGSARSNGTRSNGKTTAKKTASTGKTPAKKTGTSKTKGR